MWSGDWAKFPATPEKSSSWFLCWNGPQCRVSRSAAVCFVEPQSFDYWACWSWKVKASNKHFARLWVQKSYCKQYRCQKTALESPYNSLYTQAVPHNTYAELNFELGKPVHTLIKLKADFQSVLRSLGGLMFVSLTNIGGKSMLFVTNCLPYLWGPFKFFF